jgi:hypothetical protein
MASPPWLALRSGCAWSPRLGLGPVPRRASWGHGRGLWCLGSGGRREGLGIGQRRYGRGRVALAVGVIAGVADAATGTRERLGQSTSARSCEEQRTGTVALIFATPRGDPVRANGGCIGLHLLTLRFVTMGLSP